MQTMMCLVRIVVTLLMPGIAVADLPVDDDHLALVPPAHELLSPLLMLVPLQLVAYHAALARGCEVDRPRNLAKSVTVE